MGKIRPRAAGVNLSVDVEGGNLLISTAHPTQPRIDTVIVQEGGYLVLAGTPTVGTNFVNLAGVASPPEGTVIKGYVLVPAGATAITAAQIAANLHTPELNEWMERLSREVAEN